jgi:hypothetical protein
MVQMVLPSLVLLVLVVLQQVIPPSEFKNCQFRNVWINFFVLYILGAE